jgi:hypothetical protein
MKLMTTDDLQVALDDFIHFHQAKEYAYQSRETIKSRFEAVELDLKAAISDATDDKGKPRYSNDDRRKAELQKRLIADYAGLLHEYDKAKNDYQAASNDCERAYETLTTRRALLHYQTSENELEAARLQASTAVTYNDCATDDHASEYNIPKPLPAKPLPVRPRPSYNTDDDLPF